LEITMLLGRNQKTIALALRDGPKTTEELEALPDMTKTRVYHALRAMKARGIISGCAPHTWELAESTS
jgi:predicted transcriptional regulator